MTFVALISHNIVSSFDHANAQQPQVNCANIKSLNCTTPGATARIQTLFNQCQIISDTFKRRNKGLKSLQKKLLDQSQNLSEKCNKLGARYWKGKIDRNNSAHSDEKKQLLEEKNRVIAEKRQLIADKEKLIAEKNAALEGHRNTESLNRQISQYQSKIEEFSRKIRQLEEKEKAARQQLNKAVAERDAAKTLAGKNALLVKDRNKLVDKQKSKIKALEDTIKALQDAMPGHLRIPRQAIARDCPLCPDLMKVTVNHETRIGVPGDRINNQNHALPQMAVKLADDFAVTKTEITVGQFMAFIVDKRNGKFSRRCIIRVGLASDTSEILVTSPSAFAALGLDEPADIADHPAVCVSKADANEYIGWLNDKIQSRSKTYSLLSEVEWEYAARAHIETAPLPPSADFSMCNMMNLADLTFIKFANVGRQISLTGKDIANCQDNIALTAITGQVGASNGFGLKDMLGNVSEMTADCWFTGGKAQVSPSGTPLLTGENIDCEYSAIRGGSFASLPDHSNLWYREKIRINQGASLPKTELGYFDVGFRLKRKL